MTPVEVTDAATLITDLAAWIAHEIPDYSVIPDEDDTVILEVRGADCRVRVAMLHSEWVDLEDLVCRMTGLTSPQEAALDAMLFGEE